MRGGAQAVSVECEHGEHPMYCQQCDTHPFVPPSDLDLLRVLVESQRLYIEQHGLRHDECPEDDTCVCPLVLGISNALRAAIARLKEKP
jgi:hypothetical protein